MLTYRYRETAVILKLDIMMLFIKEEKYNDGKNDVCREYRKCLE